jgi:hypothetical protein
MRYLPMSFHLRHKLYKTWRLQSNPSLRGKLYIRKGLLPLYGVRLFQRGKVGMKQSLLPL